LRVARGIAKNETLASIQVFEALKSRGHLDGPPLTISDGWGGIDQAVIEVYGLVPEYGGRGRPVLVTWLIRQFFRIFRREFRRTILLFPPRWARFIFMNTHREHLNDRF